MSFKITAMLDGKDIEVVVTRESLNSFLEKHYPEVPPSSRLNFFGKNFGGVPSEPIVPLKRELREPQLEFSDFLWIAMRGEGVKTAFVAAQEESENYAGEDAFLRAYKRYLIVDNTRPSLDEALKKLPTLSLKPLGTRCVGVILLDFDYYLFFTSRDLYLYAKKRRDILEQKIEKAKSRLASESRLVKDK